MTGPASPAFPVARWAALAWLAVWVPCYAHAYGWRNFLQLCDVAVFLTAAGLWTGSARLLSAQLVGALVVDALWAVDVGGRVVAGTHAIGGTEYMWDPQYPLHARLMSLFHVVWPFLLWWAVRRTGYDRRGWLLQSGIAAVMLVASRVLSPDHNLNFALEAPFIRRPMGPAPLHLLLSWCSIAVGVYLPTHLLISRFLPAAPPVASRPAGRRSGGAQ
jgi:hypothetical protein